MVGDSFSTEPKQPDGLREPDLALRTFSSAGEAFAAGMKAAFASLLAYVLFATYIGIGALAHDFDFSLAWAVASTLLVWAGPAQVILISTLGAGATPVQAAIAVALSGIRLFPMVVSVLPMIKERDTRWRQLLLPAHFTAITFWVESFRLVPSIARPHRVAFANGLGSGLVLISSLATLIGHASAANLPVRVTAAVLFLTPITFLLSIARNSRSTTDWLALGLGLIATPVVGLLDTGIDLVIGGVAAGTIAYAVDRIWRAWESRR